MVNLKSKRGQAALEFLTTYGWAFMVILVMIGALAYFGVLNPTRLIPDSCAVTSGFSCTDYALTITGFNASFVNNNGRAITPDATNVAITKGGVNVKTGAACTKSPAAGAVGDGQTFFINCTISNVQPGAAWIAGDKVKLDYSFQYQFASGGGSFPHTVSGALTGTSS